MSYCKNTLNESENKNICTILYTTLIKNTDWQIPTSAGGREQLVSSHNSALVSFASLWFRAGDHKIDAYIDANAQLH